MTKGTMPDEISILRFFESGPIEKAEVLFNIVREKMRERLTGRAPDGRGPDVKTAARTRNRTVAAAVEEVPEPKV